MNKKHSACNASLYNFVKTNPTPVALEISIFPKNPPKIGGAQTSGPSPCARCLEQDAVGWEHPILFFARSWLWGFGKAAGKDV